jgi:hypothetical protein
MTDELKTLKDLNKEDMSGPYGQPYGPDYVITKELRQEAIKWKKHLKEIRDNHNGIEGYSYELAQMDFIDYFFNLTEDDLK